MAPTNQNKTKDVNKTWKEVNKIKKEQKKKWKEEKLMKQLKKVEKQKDDLKINEKDVTKLPDISTVSIALPGSILENAQSPQLRAYLAGQIARAACIFQIDEIVIFDDMCDIAEGRKSTIEDESGLKIARKCCVQLANLLQYLECPQYLRKYLFPIHTDLQFAGLMNPLDAPSHLRQNDDFMFREGVVTNKPVKAGRGSAVNVGLYQDVIIDKILTSGVRVTVQLEPRNSTHGKKQYGRVISPQIPRIETGVYWGYTVRIANSLSEVFTDSPYEKGYDLTIGTSDKGSSVDTVETLHFKHLLIVFGGLQGLEAALESDNSLDADNPSLLFNYYLNTLPQQGSRTIRTEEAILVSLAALRTKLCPKNAPKVFTSYSEYAINSGTTNSKEIQNEDLSRFD